MLGIVKMLGGVGALLAGAVSWWVSTVSAYVGFRAAVLLAATAFLLATYAALAALANTVLGALPQFPGGTFIFDFFPDQWAISSAGTAFWGTKAVKYAWIRLQKHYQMVAG